MAKTRIAKWYKRKWGKHRPSAIRSAIGYARQQVYEDIRTLHNNTVAYGPFKGLKLGEHAWWGSADRTGKLLGTYERQVVDYIANLDLGPDAVFIDVGASDGFFAVGALKGGLFKKVVAFEIAADGRAALAAVAALNDVALDVRAEADSQSFAQLANECKSGVVLIDIEGAEYDLLDQTILETLKSFHIVVELHDMFMPDGVARREKLLAEAAVHFDCDILRQAPIPIGDFPELDDFDDNLRLLAFSESRGAAMEWLTLRPKSPN